MKTIEMFPVQTRSESNGLRYFRTIKAAMSAANKDESIWKISFSLRNERVRLVKNNQNQWVFEPIISEEFIDINPNNVEG